MIHALNSFRNSFDGVLFLGIDDVNGKAVGIADDEVLRETEDQIKGLLHTFGVGENKQKITRINVKTSGKQDKFVLKVLVPSKKVSDPYVYCPGNAQTFYIRLDPLILKIQENQVELYKN